MSEEPIGKWIRVTGTDRERLKDRVAELYADQQLSVREIADQVGRSYGAVHRLLTEAGVQFRPRGNPATR